MQYSTRLTAAAAERLVAGGLWDRTTMPAACDRFAAEYGAATAVTDTERSYTWQELKTVSDGLAAALVRLGLMRGERVLVQIPGGSMDIILRLALKKAGMLGAFAPVQWREVELADALRRLRPAAVIMPLQFKGTAPGALLERLQLTMPALRYRICLESTASPGWLPLPELMAHRATLVELATLLQCQVRFDEVSNVTASSGSTGLPKLCAWPEAAQLALARGIAERLQLIPADNVGIFCPIAGGGGLMLWVCSGLVPCKYTIADDYEPEVLLSLIERERITVVATVPVILARLAQSASVERYDLRSLRAIRVGAAAANAGLLQLAEERLGCCVVQAAGTMEMGCFAQVGLDELPTIRHSGTVGRPLLGSRVRLVDDQGAPLPPDRIGELQVWAAFAAVGYVGDGTLPIQGWDPDDLTCWFSTGDLAHQDADGRISIVGRRKEMINRGGLKVFPLEVERVIARHPSVEEAAVTGVSDALYGEVPWAFVLLRPGAFAEAEELEQHVRQAGLALFKIPVRFVIVDALPRLGGTKVAKHQLLTKYTAGFAGNATEQTLGGSL